MATFSKPIDPQYVEPTRPPGLSLLCVEDDEADAYLITRALMKHPAVREVAHATDGVEALRMIEQGEIDPDLAFIDLRLPRKSGFDLLVSLSQSKQGGFPMVVLTSSSSPVDAHRSRLRSALRVITKPESVSLLETALNTAISAACPGVTPRLRPPRRARHIHVAPGVRFTGVDAWGDDQLG